MERFVQGISYGRKKKIAACGIKRNRRRPFPESALFTLGLAFVVVYFAGLLATSGTSLKYEDSGAVAVMAETDDAEARDADLWDLLDECLRDVFTKEEKTD